ncbi:MAG: methionine adenosyltransferase [Anaerohalosphaeraceae bacterium]|nr:methionine adenosyltransferase [Anaerohalosphaeraceae bacterium]
MAKKYKQGNTNCDNNNTLFTSESVTMGHPDKVADRISDSILDAMLAQDPNSRVACETMVTTGMAIVAGEITSNAIVDIPETVRKAIREIGYTDPTIGFDCDNCSVISALDKQSPDISQGVTEGSGLHKEQGAGDQGIMFGFACKETKVLMPMPIHLAHLLTRRLTKLRQNKQLPWLRPDGKSQVTVEYKNGKPVRIHTVVISTQHSDDISYKKLQNEIIKKVIMPCLPKRLVDKNTIYHVNPTGRFVVGGPKGDCGLTGRKIIVDTYGGRGCHGGGAFSGKDPSKVDRSASYMARYVAKNIVAADLADACEIQLSYAIGVAEPISVLVDTEGTAKVSEKLIAEAVRKVFPLTPKGIIKHLKLKRPIYTQTSSDGHFGRGGEDFVWEKTDMVNKLRKAVGLGQIRKKR